MSKLEEHWDDLGENNPYFAVVTFDKFYKDDNDFLDKEILDEFFKSGEDYAEKIWTEIEGNFIENFQPKKSLDFGCGVGRLSIPIAKRSEKAVGVDISQKMMDEAERNAVKIGVENLEFIKGDNELSRLKEKFDFIHSFIVIQHINPNIGENIFKKLIDLLEDGGIGALHLTYNNPEKLSLTELRYKIYRKFPFVYSLQNLILNKQNRPIIPIHTYNLNNIFRILQENDCHKCFVRFSDHGLQGVHLFFQKKADHIY